MELDISWEEQSINDCDQQHYIELLRAGIREALMLGDGPGEAEISLVMADDEAIHLLNKNYRGVDRPTDVLSFAMMEKGEGEPDINTDEDNMLGDIVISVERARVQAVEFGHSLARELVYLAVHGTFHLLGYDHDNDESRIEMRKLEELVMEKIGLFR